MKKSELIERITQKRNLPGKDIELAVTGILETMSKTLVKGGRIEIRGFGSFNLHHHEPRIGRNPKTGAAVELQGRHVPHFKPGKTLKQRVDDSNKAKF